jgi:hypothetical protein
LVATLVYEGAVYTASRPEFREGIHTIVNAARTRACATVGYFAELKRFSISGQFTTLHQAAIYSGRRF